MSTNINLSTDNWKENHRRLNNWWKKFKKLDEVNWNEKKKWNKEEKMEEKIR